MAFLRPMTRSRRSPTRQLTRHVCRQAQLPSMANSHCHLLYGRRPRVHLGQSERVQQRRMIVPTRAHRSSTVNCKKIGSYECKWQKCKAPFHSLGPCLRTETTTYGLIYRALFTCLWRRTLLPNYLKPWNCLESTSSTRI